MKRSHSQSTPPHLQQAPEAAIEPQPSDARTYSDSILETIRQPLIVLDEDRSVVSANRAFYRTFAVTPEETIGRQLLAVGHGHLTTPPLSDFLEQLEIASTAIEDYMIEIDLPKLGRRTMLLHACQLRGTPLSRPKTLIAVDDITERRRTEENSLAAQKQAEQANRGKSRFLAAASHDLRQPLQTLYLLQGLLAQKLLSNKEAMALITRLGQTLDAMAGMLNTLLDINQLEAGVVRADTVDFPIMVVLDHLRTEFSYHAASKGLGWRVVPSELKVRSDPRLLEQMIRNLLSNAMKYTKEGKILLGCRRRGNQVAIEIWDTGIGIPEEHIHAIFEEFHQLDNSARERNRGLGLGLSIVKRLGDLLGHTIRVRSHPGHGSVFAIDVPLGLNPTREWSRRGDGPADCGNHTGTVLIIEDDPAVRDTLELLIASEGHVTVAIAGGHEALALVAGDNPPDIIVADYNLPGGLSGVQVIAGLRAALKRDIPGIILTGDISTDVLRDIVRQGFLHLTKPVKADALTRLIQGFLVMSRQAPPPAQLQPAPASGNTTLSPSLARPLVIVIDDDSTVRDHMRQCLSGAGWTTETYDSCEAFLKAYRPDQSGCILIDALMPGMSGIALIERLKADGSALSPIMITGHGDVTLAVQAMKAGAVDFINKPVRQDELLASVEGAFARIQRSALGAAADTAAFSAAFSAARLTLRERQVLSLVVAGHPSKNIATDLGISQRTVEKHRAAIMKKTGSKSLPALIRLFLTA